MKEKLNLNYLLLLLFLCFPLFVQSQSFEFITSKYEASGFACMVKSVILDNHTLTNRKWEIYITLDTAATGNTLEMEMKSNDQVKLVRAEFHIIAADKDQWFYMQSTQEESSKIKIIYKKD